MGHQNGFLITWIDLARLQLFNFLKRSEVCSIPCHGFIVGHRICLAKLLGLHSGWWLITVFGWKLSNLSNRNILATEGLYSTFNHWNWCKLSFYNKKNISLGSITRNIVTARPKRGVESRPLNAFFLKTSCTTIRQSLEISLCLRNT